MFIQLDVNEYRQAQYGLRSLMGDDRRRIQREIQRRRADVVRTFIDAFIPGAVGQGQDGHAALVWFWFNHFNVFWQKDLVGVALPDYVDSAIRPNLHGRFRDLLLATMTHPAMLVYLDNAQNVAGRINENYARELLELHTLGVDGGYSQSDVRETARVLTGLGLRPLKPVRTPPHLLPLIRESGEFRFDPAKHERGAKTVLGQRIEGQGFDEVEVLVDLLVSHPATARHVAGRLCRYFLGDDVTTAAVDRAAAVFAGSGGDLAKTYAVIKEFVPSRKGRTFKDPYRWVLSAVRLLIADSPLQNARVVSRWLNLLGEPLFGCRTPDGYSLEAQDWVGAGQVTQRFDLAREMVQVLPRLSERPLSAKAVLEGAPARAVLDSLGPNSRAAVTKAASDGERLALLLASPEFMYW